MKTELLAPTEHEESQLLRMATAVMFERLRKFTASDQAIFWWLIFNQPVRALNMVLE